VIYDILEKRSLKKVSASYRFFMETLEKRKPKSKKNVKRIVYNSTFMES
jgi:hypothetical protein